MRARDRRLCFSTWAEGVALWDCVLAAVPQPVALCVMPNHLHLVTATPVTHTLGRAMGGYARRWNHQHGRRGPLWEPTPPAESVTDRNKQQRLLRYVLLNPARARLTQSAFAWPLSSYLDMTGLAVGAVRARAHDASSLHDYVGSDFSVQSEALPVADGTSPPVDAMIRAVSHVTRTPLWDVTARQGPARNLCIRAHRVLIGGSLRCTSRDLGIPLTTVRRVRATRGRDVDIVARVACAPWARGLDDVDLHRMLSLSHYRNHRSPGA